MTQDPVVRYRWHRQSSTRNGQTGWGTEPRNWVSTENERRFKLFHRGPFDARAFGSLKLARGDHASGSNDRGWIAEPKVSANKPAVKSWIMTMVVYPVLGGFPHRALDADWRRVVPCGIPGRTGCSSSTIILAPARSAGHLIAGASRNGCARIRSLT